MDPRSYDKRIGLDEAKAALEQAQHDFLRARAWSFSSSHPDSVWRWSKTWEHDGGLRCYHLGTEQALSMEMRVNGR